VVPLTSSSAAASVASVPAAAAAEEERNCLGLEGLRIQMMRSSFSSTSSFRCAAEQPSSAGLSVWAGALGAWADAFI
jgi:hypothetical protein